jgi:toxin ParE1/3/4
VPTNYRLVGPAERQIDRILLDSARQWGIDGAARYHRLMLAAMDAVGESPARPGARDVPRVKGLRVFHLRSARRLVAAEYRVSQPRHLIVYQVGADGITEILGLAHDRMLLARAARRMQREAGADARRA